MSSQVDGGVRAHAVCIPFPAQSHIKATLKFAKLLHNRGFHITFVNTEFNHNRIPDFRFTTIPDGIPSSDPDATQDVPAMCDSVMNFMVTPFRDLIGKLNDPKLMLVSGWPPVSCVVADGMMVFALQVARQVGIPSLSYWTFAACGFMGFKQYRPLYDQGLTPFKDNSYLTNGYLDMVVEVPGMKNMRLRDLPTFIQTTDPKEPIFHNLMLGAESVPIASALLIHTFDALEADVIKALNEMYPNRVYTVGPMQLLLNQIKQQHLIEFAMGFVNSGVSFLWVIRPDLVIGESAALPTEFQDKAEKTGFISTLTAGVPVLCWPFFADQQTNCKFACKDWKIGMEIDKDVKREDVEELVRELMKGNKGYEMREKAQDWARLARESTGSHGSSTIAFDRLINQVLLKK
ncbi:7-deoxyloganetin glucosyltransferase [Linum perenne]